MQHEPPDGVGRCGSPGKLIRGQAVSNFYKGGVQKTELRSDAVSSFHILSIVPFMPVSRVSFRRITLVRIFFYGDLVIKDLFSS